MGLQGQGKAFLHSQMEGLPELDGGDFREDQKNRGIIGVRHSGFDPLIELGVVFLVFQQEDIGAIPAGHRQMGQVIDLHHLTRAGGIDHLAEVVAVLLGVVKNFEM